ncbi:MAG: hypothetical protein RIR25_467, partial [Verrucomicrobiota bacterium]
MSAPEIRWRGRLAYAPALTMQEQAVAARLADDLSDTLFLLEHDAVYTI